MVACVLACMWVHVRMHAASHVWCNANAVEREFHIGIMALFWVVVRALEKTTPEIGVANRLNTCRLGYQDIALMSVALSDQHNF